MDRWISKYVQEFDHSEPERGDFILCCTTNGPFIDIPDGRQWVETLTGRQTITNAIYQASPMTPLRKCRMGITPEAPKFDVVSNRR